MAADDATTTQPKARARGSAEPRPGLVVAVGASAGALEALRTLLGGIPAGSGATFVVVVHRSPAGRESEIGELLQPYTELLVRSAEGAMPLEPDTVLVMPPATEVDGIDSQLRVVRATGSTHRARIDRVFRAVAAARGGRAIGVILTGAGSDGASGLAHIKEQGGLTVVQDPAEAEYAGMPRAAIDAGVADLVLPLREIPAAIARYSGAAPRLPADGRHDGSDTEVEPLGELLALLEKHTQRDFSVYRRSVLARRIGKRMRLKAIDDWSKYLELLRSDAAEAEALAGDVSSNAARFFRDEKMFGRLEGDVLPRLFALKASGRDTVRAWVVGCSTGEEAYSVAIALLEERSRRDAQAPIQVFASEVAEDSLQRARLGTYSPEIEDSLSAERLAKFFVRDERGYRVRSELRDVVVFACHDVVRDFPFSRLDLIVCRHAVLEDLKPQARKAVVRHFHHSLRPHGLLVVDSSVGLDLDAPELFAADGSGGLYRRLGARPSVVPPPFTGTGSTPPDGRQQADRPRRGAFDARLVHLGMLERYAPASVLVDADDRVIHYSARAGRYLRIPGGELTHEVVRLLREPLRSAVRGGLEAVDRRTAAWASDALLVHTDSGMRRVAVHVEPVGRESPVPNAKLVVFEELAARESLREDDRVQAPAYFTSVLESEIDEATRRLRAVVANGEPAARTAESGPQHDWELVRVLDDLDAAKEELRSVNEELLALNQDNRVRLEELARLSADLEVLLESTGLATLFLDRDLKVVRFTPPLLEIFDALPSDKGRPLEEVDHRLRDCDLLADARRVLKHLTPIEREVEAEQDKWYLLRMLPYRSAPQGLGGVAMTLVDITSRKKAELDLREADRRKDEFIALLAHELRNPLAPISSGIEILKRRDLDPAIAARVTLTMSRQAAQLVRLIDDLLDVSRISSGRLHLRKTPVALADIVRDAVAAVRPLIDRSGHALSVDTPRERIMLDADAARLTQVLANLLNNSGRYTPSGGKIEVRVRREGNTAAVTVKDNGYGIPESALPHVFEMFYQGADPRSTTQTGLGIGLALAKSLIDMHGGTISAASGGVDLGSEFTLRLPVLEETATHAEAEAPAAAAPLGGHRVLVVDDNADAAKTLAVLIQTLGANDVHVALSGEEALPLAERIKPDTVFLDLKMPDMDGYEVAQRMRSEPWCESTWLVALTGWGLDEHKRRTKDAGFDQHLIKPADRAALEAILSRPGAERA
jgi:two-component system, chemotaxis family, CheB/CheR fusion protein